MIVAERSLLFVDAIAQPSPETYFAGDEADCDERTDGVPSHPSNSHSVDTGKRLVNPCKCTSFNQFHLHSNRGMDASQAHGDVSRAPMQ